jgi:hypothetical protein
MHEKGSISTFNLTPKRIQLEHLEDMLMIILIKHSVECDHEILVQEESTTARQKNIDHAYKKQKKRYVSVNSPVAIPTTSCVSVSK